MFEFRVKIIDSATEDIVSSSEEDISIVRDVGVLMKESICDYNILIINLDDIYGYHISQAFSIKGDFIDFLRKPSVILCISGIEMHLTAEPTTSNYDWIPGREHFRVTNKVGESLVPTDESGRFKEIFISYNWEWKCSFNLFLPAVAPYVSIANNISDQSVALKTNFDEGKVFIIPRPEIDTKDSKAYAEFIRVIIDLCKEEIKELAAREKGEPDWVEKYVIVEELELRDEIQKLQSEYQTLLKAHRLFFEMGEALTETVSFVLSAIGFNTQNKENLGTHDIEICEDDLDIIIEVTSCEDNWINIKKTRQLLDWCRRFERERNNKPKGILIVNHYCEYPPPERDVPFTRDALKQGEDEGFCLMTTVQLYQIFCKFLKEEIDKDKIKRLLLDTKGLLKIEG